MSKDAHIEALERRHGEIEREIARESSRPHPDDGALRDLKKTKLSLKDRISGHYPG